VDFILLNILASQKLWCPFSHCLILHGTLSKHSVSARLFREDSRALNAQVPQKLIWLSRNSLLPLTSPAQSSSPLQITWHWRWVSPPRRNLTLNYYSQVRRLVYPHRGQSVGHGSSDPQVSLLWDACIWSSCPLRRLERDKPRVPIVKSLEDHSEVLTWNMARHVPWKSWRNPRDAGCLQAVGHNCIHVLIFSLSLRRYL
jgi:hypothetical protein